MMQCKDKYQVVESELVKIAYRTKFGQYSQKT